MCCTTTLTPWQFCPITTWIKRRDSESCQWNGYQVRWGQGVESNVKQTSAVKLLVSSQCHMPSSPALKTRIWMEFRSVLLAFQLASLPQKMKKVHNFPLQKDPENPKHQQCGEVYLCPTKWQRSTRLLFCIILFRCIPVSISCHVPVGAGVCELGSYTVSVHTSSDISAECSGLWRWHQAESHA